jgi:hypothetical protein
MKKLRKLLLLILLYPTFLFSQQWPEPGAIWTYCTGDPDLPITTILGKTTMAYTRDTVVEGLTYNVVEREYGSTDEYNRYLTRYSNDTVYRWINDAEYLYFHFNLNMGEVITTFRSIAGTSDTSCSSILPLEVIDSTTITISGEELTRWTLRDTLGFDPMGTGSPFFKEYTLIERIGIADYYRFYDPVEGEDCNMIIWEGAVYLDGYNDDTFEEWEADCPVSGLDEMSFEQFEIYPNPFSSFTTISYQLNLVNKVQINITDLHGKQIAQEDLGLQTTGEHSYQLFTENWAEGVYLYTLKVGDDQLTKRMVLLR